MNENEKQLSQRAYLLRAREAFCRVCEDKKCCDESGTQSVDYRNKCGKLLEFSAINKELVQKEWSNLITKKQCSECKKVYAIKNFRKSLYSVDGYGTICSNCCDAKRSLKADNKQNVSKTYPKVMEVRELESLIGKTDGVKYERRDLIAMRLGVRYRYDEEYREKMKLEAKKQYYSKDQLYVAKKYLKRHLRALEETKKKLEETQEKIRLRDGKHYENIISEIKLKDKIEILNSKIVLERSIIEKSLPKVKEELENLGIKNLSFKSILRRNIEIEDSQ